MGSQIVVYASLLVFAEQSWYLLILPRLLLLRKQIKWEKTPDLRNSEQKEKQKQTSG